MQRPKLSDVSEALLAKVDPILEKFYSDMEAMVKIAEKAYWSKELLNKVKHLKTIADMALSMRSDLITITPPLNQKEYRRKRNLSFRKRGECVSCSSNANPVKAIQGQSRCKECADKARAAVTKCRSKKRASNEG